MRGSLAVAVCGLLFLAGCSGRSFNGLNETQASQLGAGSAGAKLTGSVRGGQQPIVGAHVYLFAANTTGYGGVGIAASSSNASVSLLTSAGNTALDSSGGATNGDYYVTTDSGGGFSITGDYTCTTGAQVYLYALGGNPGAGVNSAAGLLAALGSCPSAGSFLAVTPYIVVNEVSTIAAAYAMAGFATDATHVSSSGTALAQTGIANAFANAGNLAGISTGTALTTTPAGNGTVPQAEINTLANVLAACVNTNGPGSTACSTLLANAKSSGSTGVVATDTATAAINIAHNPGSDVAALYALGTPTPPFAPALSARPNDFTVALTFTGGGQFYPGEVAIDGAGNAWVVNYNSVTKLSSAGVALSPTAGYTGGGLSQSGGGGIAIDSAGDAWIANGNNSVTEFSNSGVAISPTAGYTGGGLSNPYSIAIDGLGNAWVENANNSVTKLSNSGTAISPTVGYTGGGLNGPDAIAIDSSGNAWVANGNNSVTELSSSGTAISPTAGYSATASGGPEAIAVDAYGDAWVANTDCLYGYSSVTKLSNSGVAISPSGGYTAVGQSCFWRLAVDGSGNAWVTDLGNESSLSLTEFSNSGVAISPAGGYTYTGGGLSESSGIALDGSGDVWVTSNGPIFAITEFIGAGTPVVTPLATGVKNNTLGTRP